MIRDTSHSQSNLELSPFVFLLLRRHGRMTSEDLLDVAIPQR